MHILVPGPMSKREPWRKQSWVAFGKDGWICREQHFDFLSYMSFCFDWEAIANDLLVAPTANNWLQVDTSVFTLARGLLGGTVVCEFSAKP